MDPDEFREVLVSEDKYRLAIITAALGPVLLLMNSLGFVTSLGWYLDKLAVTMVFVLGITPAIIMAFYVHRNRMMIWQFNVDKIKNRCVEKYFAEYEEIYDGDASNKGRLLSDIHGLALSMVVFEYLISIIMVVLLVWI